jgi:hypothetical protein
MRHAADLIALALSLPHLDVSFRPDNALGFDAKTKDGQKVVVLFGKNHYADNRFYDYRVGLESKTVELFGFGVPQGAMSNDPQPYVPVEDAAVFLRNLNDHGANLAFQTGLKKWYTDRVAK